MSITVFFPFFFYDIFLIWLPQMCARDEELERGSILFYFWLQSLFFSPPPPPIRPPPRGGTDSLRLFGVTQSDRAVPRLPVNWSELINH